MEYLRANYKKALKVLSSAPKTPIVTDAGECLGSLMFNNMGCIHYDLGKYHLAAHYFRKAVDENDAALNGYPPLDRGDYCNLIYCVQTTNEFCYMQVVTIVDFTL